MKKISFLVLPFLLTACFSKTSITPIPQENIVSKEVAPVVKIEDPKPIIAPNETEKAIIGKKVTPPQKIINTDEKTDDMTTELDKLIDDIVGG